MRLLRAGITISGVAVLGLSSYGLSAFGAAADPLQATLNRLFPGEYPEVPEGGSVWVFALE